MGCVSLMALYVLSVDSLTSRSLIVRTSDALSLNGNRIMPCHQESASEKCLLNGPLCGTRSESAAGRSDSSADGTVDQIPHIAMPVVQMMQNRTNFVLNGVLNTRSCR